MDDEMAFRVEKNMLTNEPSETGHISVNQEKVTSTHF